MRTIQLYNGNLTLVDDEDYDRLSKFKWNESDGYAVTSAYIETGEYKINLRMHRMLMNAPDDKVVDHINSNRLDNRKDNLRIATIRQNTINSRKRKNGTSIYKGVSREKSRYIVKIKNDEKHHIGSFVDEIAAANAYNYYAKLYFGEFAWLNNVPFMEKEEWEKYKSKPTSAYKGVSWAKDTKKWAVQVWDGKESKFVGFFEDEIVAANYYNHLTKKEINECNYISLEECESKKHKRKKTSKYRGVSWERRKQKWEVNVWNGNQKYFVGYFDSEIEAALSYNKKAQELGVKYIERKLNVIDNED